MTINRSSWHSFNPCGWISFALDRSLDWEGFFKLPIVKEIDELMQQTDWLDNPNYIIAAVLITLALKDTSPAEYIKADPTIVPGLMDDVFTVAGLRPNMCLSKNQRIIFEHARQVFADHPPIDEIVQKYHREPFDWLSFYNQNEEQPR